MNWEDLAGRLMHQHGWLPWHLLGMTVDEFGFAIHHTHRLNMEAAKT